MRSLIRPLAALAVAAAATPATSANAQQAHDHTAGAPGVHNSSYVAPDGSRVLQHSLVVRAPQAKVWETWTTTEGLKGFVAPIVHIDFRLGGIWESSYDPKKAIGQPGNIQNRILSFLPPRMLSIQAVSAPPNFPHSELLTGIFTVIEMDAVDSASTKVTVSMVGYRSGEGYDAIYRLFDAGNAYTLRKLAEYLEGRQSGMGNRE